MHTHRGFQIAKSARSLHPRPERYLDNLPRPREKKCKSRQRQVEPRAALVDYRCHSIVVAPTRDRQIMDRYSELRPQDLLVDICMLVCARAADVERRERCKAKSSGQK